MSIVLMPKRKKISLILFFIIYLLFFTFPGDGLFAQLADTGITHVDTGFKKEIKVLKEAASNDAEASIAKFKSSRVAIHQAELLENINETIDRVKHYLRFIDTNDISKELKEISEWDVIANDGISFNHEAPQTHRNLTTSSIIIDELLKRVNKQKTVVDKYEKALMAFRYNIDSLTSDKVLFNLPSDSVQQVRYIQKLLIVLKTFEPADSALTQAIDLIRNLQSQLSTQAFKLANDIDQIDSYQKFLSKRMFEQNFGSIRHRIVNERPPDKVISVSVKKGLLALWIFVHNRPFKIFLILVLLLSLWWFLRSLRRLLVNVKKLKNDFTEHLILRHPFYSAVVIVISIFQFIFTQPPFILNFILWISAAVSLTIVFRGFISTTWMRIWLVLLVLFFLTCCDNLILQPSRAERWFMLLLALIGVFVSGAVLINKRSGLLRERWTVYFIIIAFLLEVFSVVLNLTGRYDLSKTLLLTGYANVILGMLFLWTARLINEGLMIASSAYTQQERNLFYINFDKVGSKAPTWLYVLLAIGWIVLLGRNVYAFQMITTPIIEFIFAERTLGSYSFSIGNLLTFFVVLSVSVIISKIVTYFVSEKSSYHTQDKGKRKPGLGSWLLVIRIIIIIVGLLLGLAASGFPMDRITLIIGALGIGVGLGLQTLVTNLVSGIIIAFEKPVNVGDIVEFSGQTGTVKSIGFRSSVITILSGADMIVPNGDILNMHLFNWSIGGGKKNMEIIVGVEYGTDLNRTKKIILDLLIRNDKVLKHPSPSVIFQKFADSSINVQILFWVRDIREGLIIRSEVIEDIDNSFKQNGINIPFPRQDVQIINSSNENNEQKANHINV